MTDDRAYRIVSSFDPEQKVFRARVPELDIDTRAASRGDAIALAEQAIDAKVEEAATRDTALPPPIDVDLRDNTLNLRIASELRRDLEFHARVQRMSVEEMATQLLALALGRLDGQSAQREHATEVESRPPRPSRPDGDPAQGRGRRGRREEGYRSDLEDKANFMDYVRGLERGERGRGRR